MILPKCLWREELYINSKRETCSVAIISVEFHVDPDTKKLVNTALSVQIDDKAPEFITKPKRQFIDEGDTARFKASFEGSTDTVISWSFNGKTITKDDRHKVEFSPFNRFPAF